jgi:hypothetical protein
LLIPSLWFLFVPSLWLGMPVWRLCLLAFFVYVFLASGEWIGEAELLVRIPWQSQGTNKVFRSFREDKTQNHAS